MATTCSFLVLGVGTFFDWFDIPGGFVFIMPSVAVSMIVAAEKLLDARTASLSEFDRLLADFRLLVELPDVYASDDLELRRSSVELLYSMRIRISDDSVLWIPSGVSSDFDEMLAWIWFTRPDLAPDVLPLVDGDFAQLIECYAEGRMADAYVQRVTSSDTVWPHCCGVLTQTPSRPFRSARVVQSHNRLTFHALL